MRPPYLPIATFILQRNTKYKLIEENPMKRRPPVLGVLLLAAMLFLPAFAQAQSYPVKPIRLVTPFPSGSGADVIGRIYTPKLVETFSQQLVVDSHPGAAGNIAAEVVAHAPPDGYTLLLLTTSNVSSQALNKSLPFDIGRDFQPIAMLGTASYLLAVNTALPVNNVADLIALAKARPGQLNYASTGTGGGLHLTMEMFMLQAGIKMLHIPYKGSVNTVPDMIGGRIDAMFGSILSLLPHVRSGRIRALGVTSTKRSGSIPDVPTIAESGLPGFESVSWFALLAPAGTPTAVVARLNTAIIKAAQMPEIVTALAHQGTDPVLMTPEQTRTYVRDELLKWKKVVTAAGVQIE